MNQRKTANRLLFILQGKFIRHPLHSLFVHLPVALWPMSLASDVIYWFNPTHLFAAMSYYLLLFGTLGAPSIITEGETLLTAIGVGVFGVSGYLGGKLVYQHGIGMQKPSNLTGKPSIRRAA